MGVVVLDIVANTYKTLTEPVLVAGAAAFFNSIIQIQYLNLARDYYDLYYDQRNFYYSNFQQQGESPFANEQFATPFYIPDYVGLAGGGVFPPGVLLLFNPEIVNRATNMAASWSRKARMYNAILDTSSFAMDMASTADDWFSYMFRYEEHKRDVFNERRWANQMDSLSYAVKEAASVERGLATSFGVFDEAGDQLVSEINSVANGLATYQAQRQAIRSMYPGPVTSPQAQTSNFDRIFGNGFEQ